MKETLQRLARSLKEIRSPTLQAGGDTPVVRKRILVVDDDLHSREGVRSALLAAGSDVEAAADAWEALRKVKDRRFDVAILDLNLPPVHGLEVTGWDLVRILRAYSPSVSIILVSSDNDAALRAEASRLRVVELLEKPISLSHLKRIVHALIA
jgi:CheY-like chemotaxis protein